MLNGLLIVFLRVQPVVVTLAMYFILQGVDLVSSPQPQALPGNGGWTTHLAGSVGPIPGAAVHDRRAAADLVRPAASSRSGATSTRSAATTTTAFSSGVNVNAVRDRQLRARRAVRRHRRARADRPRQHRPTRPSRPSTRSSAIAAVALGGTSLAGGRGGLIGALLRGVRDLPAAEPALHVADRPGLPADRLRRDARRRGRDRRPC